jgi:hypothetical protein
MKIFWIVSLIKIFYPKAVRDRWRYIGFFRSFEEANVITAAVWKALSIMVGGFMIGFVTSHIILGVVHKVILLIN